MKEISDETHESNTASNNQAEGGDALGGSSTGGVWDWASGGSGWSSMASGGNGWASNTGRSRGASVDGGDTGTLLACLYRPPDSMATHSTADATAAMAARVRARTLNCILTVEWLFNLKWFEWLS